MGWRSVKTVKKQYDNNKRGLDGRVATKTNNHKATLPASFKGRKDDNYDALKLRCVLKSSQTDHKSWSRNFAALFTKDNLKSIPQIEKCRIQTDFERL